MSDSFRVRANNAQASLQSRVQNSSDEKPEETFSRGYFVHKVGTQFVAGVLKSGGTIYRTVAEYQVYKSRFLSNPNEDIFQDPAGTIYNPHTKTGRFLETIFLPSKYRGGNLKGEEIRELRENHAIRSTLKQVPLTKASNAVQIASNIGALYYCQADDTTCTGQQYATIVSNSISAGAYYVAIHFQGKGSKMVGIAGQTANRTQAEAYKLQAYNTLNFARRTFITMNFAEIVAGTAKIGIEMGHAIQEPDQFNLSAVADGGLHVGIGASWFIYNNYLAREASKFAKNPATMDKAIDVLWVHARVIPPKILWAARGFGSIGPLVSFGISSRDFYHGITDATLSAGVQQHKVISGTMGMTSAALFLGFAFFMTPAAAPIGVAFFATGLGLVAIQTIYDEWDNIENYLTENNGETTHTALNSSQKRLLASLGGKWFFDPLFMSSIESTHHVP